MTNENFFRKLSSLPSRNADATGRRFLTWLLLASGPGARRIAGSAAGPCVAPERSERRGRSSRSGGWRQGLRRCLRGNIPRTRGSPASGDRSEICRRHRRPGACQKRRARKCRRVGDNCKRTTASLKTKGAAPKNPHTTAACRAPDGGLPKDAFNSRSRKWIQDGLA
jgi:hypothetical protein